MAKTKHIFYPMWEQAFGTDPALEFAELEILGIDDTFKLVQPLYSKFEKTDMVPHWGHMSPGAYILDPQYYTGDVDWCDDSFNIYDELAKRRVVLGESIFLIFESYDFSWQDEAIRISTKDLGKMWKLVKEEASETKFFDEKLDWLAYATIEYDVLGVLFPKT